VIRGYRTAMVVALGLAAPAVLAADVAPPRVASLRELGAAFKNVNDELKSGTPQIYIIQLSARQIRDVAKLQYGWFPAGSGPAPGRKTAAKPEIWTQPAKFKAAQDAFAAEAAGFMKVAQGGNVGAIKVAAKSLGQTCGGCHRPFRVEER
jgi:cytochrome c556